MIAARFEYLEGIRTRYSFTLDRMFELDAPLAGEMSGHMFFEDRYLGFDDATYAACAAAVHCGISPAASPKSRRGSSSRRACSPPWSSS